MVNDEMLDDTLDAFKDKLENCDNCIVHDEATRICRKHKMMIAKYVRKKHKASIKEMAGMMAGMMEKQGEKDG